MEQKKLSDNEKYIRRCIQLARNAAQNAAPNPMVGAVIVHDGRIIGEGYHVRCGEGHAEVNAIASVKERHLLKESTIYVSLEPCSHYGKTPPCADLIINTGIPKVVIGCMDPFAKVAGQGIKKLRDAGIDVTVGVLEKECMELNVKFMMFHTAKRPYITLKWAESTDGFIDRKREYGDGNHATKLSTATTQALVHKRRAEHMAILVGRRTALLDNPTLDSRLWGGRSPIRIVIDKDLSLPGGLRIFNTPQSTWIVCSKQCKDIPDAKENKRYLALDFEQEIMPQLFEAMHRENIISLLVEGGSETHKRLIGQGLWDEAIVETAPISLGEGIKAAAINKELFERKEIVDNHLISYYRNKQLLNISIK